MRVFLDRNVEADSYIFEYNILGDKKYILPRSKESMVKDLSVFLQTYNAEFFSSFELHLEGQHGALFPSKLRTNLFDDIEIKMLEPPFDRSRFGLTDDQALRKGDHRNAVVEWCQMLENIDKDRAERYISGKTAIQLTPFEKKCLNNISTFKALCKNIHEKHFPDIYHFWTAIEHNMDVFLTHEKKFRNEVSKNLESLDIRCKIMNSSELLKSLTP